MENRPTTKSCSACGYTFALSTIAMDPTIQPVGMQFLDVEHERNYFFFNHVCESCGSTILIPVLHFLPLIEEPVPDLALTGLEKCGGHCLRVEDLRDCAAPCRYAPFRRYLLKLIGEAPDRAQAGSRAEARLRARTGSSSGPVPGSEAAA